MSLDAWGIAYRKWAERHPRSERFWVAFELTPGATAPRLGDAPTQDLLLIQSSSTPFRTPDEFVAFVFAAQSPALLVFRLFGALGLGRGHGRLRRCASPAVARRRRRRRGSHRGRVLQLVPAAPRGPRRAGVARRREHRAIARMAKGLADRSGGELVSAAQKEALIALHRGPIDLDERGDA